ncbi:MAG: hypothetical protein V3V25_07610 [Paracoccaceae bacterium]
MIEWQGYAVFVTCTRNWLDTGYHHIELRCETPLPVSETGYRSHFIASDELDQFASPVDFVLEWLDETAQSKEWKRYVQDSRQLKLF